MAAQSLALTGGVDALGQWSLDRVSAIRRPARAVRMDGSHVAALLDASGHELHREPLTVYAESRSGGWAARVPRPSDGICFVVVRARDGRVLLEERIGPMAAGSAAVDADVTQP